MKLILKRHLKKNQNAIENQTDQDNGSERRNSGPMSKSNVEYLINQTIIWIAIVVIAVVIIKKLI